VTKIGDGFASLARVRTPDVWADALGREPGRLPDGPSPVGRLAVAVLSLAVFVGGFSYLATTFDAARAPGGSTMRPPAASSAPGWLVTKAFDMAKGNGDAHPTSAQWVLTDADTAAPAVGLASGDPDVREYLVVMQGDFVARYASVPAGQPLPRGSVLTFTADPETREIRDLGVSNSVPHVPGLQDLPLPTG
jgi:hypothetical protein